MASIDGWVAQGNGMASVDLVARLVDIAVFRGLCSIPGDQLALALSKGELRDKRPDQISSLDRAFDILSLIHI